MLQLNYDYKLVVLGNPKPQARHRTYTKGRDGRPLPYPLQVDPSAKDKKNLRQVVQDQAPETPLDCPLKVVIQFFFPYRKGDFGTGRNEGVLKESAPAWHTTRPDCDNCIKMVLDALNGVFWRDDTVICKLETEKKYSLNPRTEIFITKI